MQKITVAKFGGSTIGAEIVKRVQHLAKESKMVLVFSAPLSEEANRRSVTDIMLDIGRAAESNTEYDFARIKRVYDGVLENIPEKCRQSCRKIIDGYLEKCTQMLKSAAEGKFADEIRSKALAYSGELLMSDIMNEVLCERGIASKAVSFDFWPIITDNNIESTNFLYSESEQHLPEILRLIETYSVITMGGFIGKTTDGIVTTYERGGSDRTAVDMGILLHKKFNVSINFEKDFAVYSADPRIVKDGSMINELSYNEARLAATFGMKILDPIAIKEIHECGAEMKLVVSNIKNPKEFTSIYRDLKTSPPNPLKIVTGKKNCVILRMEKKPSENMLSSLENEKRYGEFIVLSPFYRDGMEFVRILFLDGDYVKRNEKYFLAFDSLASITYKRAAITIIGDEMWRAQNIVAKISARLGQANINILNIDAQEETSRVIIITDDADDTLKKSIKAIHLERVKLV